MAHQVIPIEILPRGMINAYLVRADGGGAVLVDTGIPGKVDRIRTTLVAQGLEWRDLRTIIITHSHPDHTGNAAEVARLSGAPVMIHSLDAEAAAGREKKPFNPTGIMGRVLRHIGPKTPPPPVEADVRLEGPGPFDLTAVGLLGARAILTPGHTMGSLSVLLPDGTAICGDLLISGILLGGIALKGWVRRSLTEEDPTAIAASLTNLIERGATRFHLGHGGPLARPAVERHILRELRLVAS
jgi:hydroxyacylglutathione hydrolase